MRAYRKKSWASLVVNLTPLIDVVFLIIIFFMMMMNFSEVVIRQVKLPLADESKKTYEDALSKIIITIKSSNLVFVNRKTISLNELGNVLNQKTIDPQRSVAQIRGNENIPYEIVQKVMQRIAASGITRIEFSTRKE